jgi:hypothetical protein
MANQKNLQPENLNFLKHLLVAGVVANLPPVPLIPVVHLDLQISPRILEKISK